MTTSMAAAASISARLDEAGLPEDARSALKRSIVKGSVAVVFTLGLASVWFVWAPLTGAVVASGVVKSEHNRKVVQHQEGGIVEKVHVRDGQMVQAAELLISLADVRSDASRDLLRTQRWGEWIRRARLEAETELAAGFQVPASVPSNPQTVEALARERKLFAARRRTLDEQLASYDLQMRDTAAQVEQQFAQVQATEAGQKLALEELMLNESLVEQGYVQKTRLITLKRVLADYDSRLGDQRSSEAQARQRLADLKLRAVQARNAYQQQAADELKELSGKLSELEERLRPAEDQSERLQVRAPVAGVVMGLRATNPGQTFGPRDVLMEVVPSEEALVVETRVRPEDIDHVHVGGHADVRFTALDHRRAPNLRAEVVFVSPDRFQDNQTGAAWFVAQVRVDPASLAEHRQVRVHAGLPAEVYIATRPRSLLDYLIEPINAFKERAMREP